MKKTPSASDLQLTLSLVQPEEERCVEEPEASLPKTSASLMAQVLERENLIRALKQVQRNKGAPGLDGMNVEALSGYLKVHWPRIQAELTEGRCVEGVPQGGPLSPVLSNVVLDELDWELHRRGHAFARYADDCNVFVSSRVAGERTMVSLQRFIEGPLRLKVNAEKSAVDRPRYFRDLGLPELAAR